MYIGPWQEYKLAQVIRFKNDIYEGKNQRLNTQALSMHDNINKTNEKSHISTPSTRSFSSEPVQKPYPKFDIDTYCNQWKKVETIISKSDQVNKKPPLPKSSIRKRQGKSIQEKRVNKMRMLYGIENKHNLPQVCVTQSPKNEERKTFAEKIRDDIKNSENYINLADKMKPKENNDEYKFVNEPLEEIREKKGFSSKFKEDIKSSGVYDNNRIKNTGDIKKQITTNINNEEGSKGINLNKPKSPDKVSKFNSIAINQELDVIEESLNQENIDGLLQWVENLPDELSGSHMISSKGFVL